MTEKCYSCSGCTKSELLCFTSNVLWIWIFHKGVGGGEGTTRGAPVVCALTHNTQSKRACSCPETWKTWCLNQCPAVLWAPSEDRGLAPLSSAMNMELFCGAGLGYVFCLICLPHSHFKGRSTQGFDFLICLATDSTTCMQYQAPGLRGRLSRSSALGTDPNTSPSLLLSCSLSTSAGGLYSYFSSEAIRTPSQPFWGEMPCHTKSSQKLRQ